MGYTTLVPATGADIGMWPPAAFTFDAAGRPLSPKSSVALHELLRNLAASWQFSPSVFQNRRGHRFAIRKQVTITPLDDRTSKPIAEPQLVVSRDLSLGGISFAHSNLLPYRTVAVNFNHDQDAVVTRLTWCRFTRLGSYLSGGRFLGILDPDKLSSDNESLQP